MNRYFEIVSPVRIYRHVGRSESNTWIGRSRVINRVSRAENARPGDQIHALVGGTFLVRGDEVHEIFLWRPKHILERGGSPSAVSTMERYAKAGRARETDAPIMKPDYGAGRKKGEVDLPPLSPDVVEIEPSPELQVLKEDVESAVAALEREGFDGKIKFRDMDAYGWPSAKVAFGEREFRVLIYSDFGVRIFEGRDFLADLRPEECESGIVAALRERLAAGSQPSP